MMAVVTIKPSNERTGSHSDAVENTEDGDGPGKKMG